MPLCSLDDLHDRADSCHARAPVAVAGGADASVLQALRCAVDRQWIEPFVVGVAHEIRSLAAECEIGLEGMSIVDAADCATAAVAIARATPGCLLMKGQVATPALMRAMLDPAAGLRTGRVICQVVLLELFDAGRRLLLADTGICIQPTLEQKGEILASAVNVAHRLGEACPRVACLAATETTIDAMPETIDAAELERRNRAGAITDCIVRGPLSFDLAFDTDAAVRKKRADPDFGVADVLLFPNLLAANLTVKAIMYTARCRFGGVLCGAACPVVFMSRADTPATRLHSLAVALSACGI
jgi:phosphotransacetylase